MSSLLDAWAHQAPLQGPFSQIFQVRSWCAGFLPSGAIAIGKPNWWALSVVRWAWNQICRETFQQASDLSTTRSFCVANFDCPGLLFSCKLTKLWISAMFTSYSKCVHKPPYYGRISIWGPIAYFSGCRRAHPRWCEPQANSIALDYCIFFLPWRLD